MSEEDGTDKIRIPCTQMYTLNSSGETEFLGSGPRLDRFLTFLKDADLRSDGCLKYNELSEHVVG